MYDSKAWTPLYFLPPILWLLVSTMFTYQDLLIWFVVKAAGVGGLYLAFLAQFSGVHPDSNPGAKSSNFQTEQAYVIRANRTMQWDTLHYTFKGSELVVNNKTMEKALATGDYDFVNTATGRDAGDHYVNDGSGGTGSYVPPGQIVVEHSTYYDERLNG